MHLSDFLNRYRTIDFSHGYLDLFRSGDTFYIYQALSQYIGIGFFRRINFYLFQWLAHRYLLF